MESSRVYLKPIICSTKLWAWTLLFAHSASLGAVCILQPFAEITIFESLLRMCLALFMMPGWPVPRCYPAIHQYRRMLKKFCILGTGAGRIKIVEQGKLFVVTLNFLLRHNLGLHALSYLLCSAICTQRHPALASSLVEEKMNGFALCDSCLGIAATFSAGALQCCVATLA